MITSRFDAEKALEVILYIAEKTQTPTLYYIGKILYFADKAHLQKYGRLICGDSYVAMKLGPVPSSTYDILKYVRGTSNLIDFIKAKESFSINSNHTIQLFRVPDLSYFSESDLECLNNSITTNGSLTFGQLKRKGHKEKAYKSAKENDFMPIESIIATLDNSDGILENLQDC